MPKLTTKEFQDRLAPIPWPPWENPKCWELAIEAFGITGERTGRRQYEDFILSKFSPGFKLEKVSQLAPAGMPATLAIFLRAHLQGNWIVFTRGHCLAIRDGVIHDTMRNATVKEGRDQRLPRHLEGNHPHRAAYMRVQRSAGLFGHWSVCRGVPGSPNFFGHYGAKA